MTSKCYSIDNEAFNYDELGDLFADLESDGELYEGRVYYEADCKVVEPKDYVNSHSVSCMLESLDEQLYDDVGEVSDNDFYNTSKEAKEELRQFLESWITKHVNVGRYWTIVGQSRELQVTKDDLK